jgi:hypothetical protein
MQIHLARNGQAMGPFSLEEVIRQLAAGTLTGTDLAWYEGAAGWAPLSSVPGVIISGISPSASPAPAVAAAPAPVPHPAAPAAPTEPLAIASLILSILGIVCCGPLFLVPALICGHLALPKFRARPELQGRGLAIAGLVISYVAIAGWLIWVVLWGGWAVLQGILEGVRK